MKHLAVALKKEITSHLFDYLILITSGIFFVLFLNVFSGQKILMFFVITAFASFYILWGLSHHARSQTLHIKNVIEYVLIGFIVLFLIATLLF